MGLAYLPTFANLILPLKNNQMIPNVDKYTSPMDGYGTTTPFGAVAQPKVKKGVPIADAEVTGHGCILCRFRRCLRKGAMNYCGWFRNPANHLGWC